MLIVISYRWTVPLVGVIWCFHGAWCWPNWTSICLWFLCFPRDDRIFSPEGQRLFPSLASSFYLICAHSFPSFLPLSHLFPTSFLSLLLSFFPPTLPSLQTSLLFLFTLSLPFLSSLSFSQFLANSEENNRYFCMKRLFLFHLKQKVFLQKQSVLFPNIHRLLKSVWVFSDWLEFTPWVASKHD